MKNKFRFIMPRLIGATALAGIAALVITTVFKLLLGLTLLAGVVTLVVRSLGRHRRQLQYGEGAMPGLGNWSAFGNNTAANNPIQPVAGYASQKGSTIVPVD